MQVVPLEPTRSRLRGDDGSALIEAAIITPVFIYTLFGILELGLLFKDYLAIGAATQDGARTAAILGNAPDTDYQIIQSMKKSLSPIGNSQIRNVVVWHATSPASSVPSGCTAAVSRTQISGANGCNVYTPTDDFGYPPNDPVVGALYNCTATGFSKGYCPATRHTALTGVNSPPDYLGITVTVNHTYLTGLFGSSKLLIDTTITRLEPQTLA